MTGVRKALIVATYEYDDPGLAELHAPERDAEALADVLGDRAVGNFEVQTVVNQPAHEVNRTVARFFKGGRPGDVQLVHFSCHGVKSDSGQLYFATRDTALDLLQASAVSAAFVNEEMQGSRAGTTLLLLDCCYSGAFGRGMNPRAGDTVDVGERLGGRGRAVITASSAMQFAFENGSLSDGDVDVSPSIFTGAVVRGLATGDADRDLNGEVTLDEFYGYVHDEVVRVNPNQTPKLFAFDVEGNLVVAHRGTPVTTPSDLPDHLTGVLDDVAPWVRASAIKPLTKLVGGSHPGLAFAARLKLEAMAEHDDSLDNRAAAAAALAAVPAESLDATAVPTDDPVVQPVVDPLVDPVEPVAETAVEPVVDDEPALEPRAESEPGLSPYTDHSTQVLPIVEPEPIGGTDDVREDDRGRRLWVAAATATVLVVAGVGYGVQLATDPGTSTVEPPLPESEILLTTGDGAGRKLILYDVDTQRVVRVLKRDPDAVLPTISPDRTSVAYLKVTHDITGTNAVPHIIDLGDDSVDRPLLDEHTTDACPTTTRPAWSPDGSELAFVCLQTSSEPNSPGDLWVVSKDGTGARRLSLETTPSNAVAPTNAATWGGDGRIYFQGRSETDGVPDTLWWVDQDGGTPTQLTFGKHGSDSNPDWSERGLLFLRTKPHGRVGIGDVFMIDLKSDNLHSTPLTRRTGEAMRATWSPDGSEALWLQGKAQSMRLYRWRDHDASPLALSGSLGAPAWGSR